jgi:hypothetical protein
MGGFAPATTIRSYRPRVPQESKELPVKGRGQTHVPAAASPYLATKPIVQKCARGYWNSLTTAPSGECGCKENDNLLNSARVWPTYWILPVDVKRKTS